MDPSRIPHLRFIFAAACLLGVCAPGCCAALDDPGGREPAWARAVNPVDRGVYPEGIIVLVECLFSRPPPPGGTFGLAVNGKEVCGTMTSPLNDHAER